MSQKSHHFPSPDCRETISVVIVFDGGVSFSPDIGKKYKREAAEAAKNTDECRFEEEVERRIRIITSEGRQDSWPLRGTKKQDGG